MLRVQEVDVKFEAGHPSFLVELLESGLGEPTRKTMC